MEEVEFISTQSYLVKKELILSIDNLSSFFYIIFLESEIHYRCNDKAYTYHMSLGKSLL